MAEIPWDEERGWEDLKKIDPDQVARRSLQALGITCRPVDLIGRRFSLLLRWDDHTHEPFAVYGSIAGVEFYSPVKLTLYPHPVGEDCTTIGAIHVNSRVDHQTWEVEIVSGNDNKDALLTLY